MQPRAIIPHIAQISEVADEFVEKMRTLRDPKTLELPDDFKNELYKWALECEFVRRILFRRRCFIHSSSKMEIKYRGEWNIRTCKTRL